ncbi:MAG: RNA polymerase sigma-70 factor [Chitinophagaceae bacterium]
MGDSLGILQNKIAEGDLKAYECLYRLSYHSLLRFGISLTKNKQVTEEIVSDVLAHIWFHRDNILQIANLKTYLFIAVKNNCLKHLSRSRTVMDIEDCDIIACFATPEKKMLSDELYQKIQNAIQSLPSRCKMCFQLVKEEGLSYKETAAVLGISPKTVDAQIVTALKKIAEKISEK